MPIKVKNDCKRNITNSEQLNRIKSDKGKLKNITIIMVNIIKERWKMICQIA
jgi:hypothetical protein